MARNSGGTYSLPTGNPVATGTAISSTVHNNTMNDIKTELTDSLSRSNKGAMLAQLQLFDGTESVPGLAWGTDSDTGFYKIGAGNIGFSINGVKLLEMSLNNFFLNGADPTIWLVETDAAVDEKNWLLFSSAGNFYVSAYNDARDANANPIAMVRSGITIDSITFTATQINLNCTAAAVNGAFGVSGVATFSSELKISNSQPYLLFYEADAAADEKYWRWMASGGNLYLQILDDTPTSGVSPISITRSAGTIDAIDFAATSVKVNTKEVAVQTSGTFTMELATDSSGGSVLASGGASWRRVGDVITMRLPCLLATTTDTSLYLRGIPAECQPTLTGVTYQCPIVPGKINGADGIIQIDVYENSAFWLLEGMTAAFSAGSAQKGVGVTSGFCPVITYLMAD